MTMKVFELVEALKDLPDPNAIVVVAQSSIPGRDWLAATGVIERKIQLSKENPDVALPGKDPGVEIV